MGQADAFLGMETVAVGPTMGQGADHPLQLYACRVGCHIGATEPCNSAHRGQDP